MYHLYEDVAPAAVLRKRKPAIGDDGPTMYLVRYRDGTEDSWLPAEFLSAEVSSLYALYLLLFNVRQMGAVHDGVH